MRRGQSQRSGAMAKEPHPLQDISRHSLISLEQCGRSVTARGLSTGRNAGSFGSLELIAATICRGC